MMDPIDRAYYRPGIHPPYLENHHPPPQNDISESSIQKGFATECYNRGWRPVWNGMHKRSTSNRGSPDFIIAAYGYTFWVEFKRVGEDLSPDQSVFKKQLEANGVTMYVCFSVGEAVQLIEEYGEEHRRFVAQLSGVEHPSA